MSNRVLYGPLIAAALYTSIPAVAQSTVPAVGQGTAAANGAAASTSDTKDGSSATAKATPANVTPYQPMIGYSRTYSQLLRSAILQTPTTPPAAAPAAPAAPTAPVTRAAPSPIDSPPFPISDWTTNSGWPIGETWAGPVGPLQHWMFGTKYDNTNWRVGGWIDGGIEISSSTNSNLPDTYNLVPNHPELDQAVFVMQKQVDTVQTKHVDWGFYSASLFGIDYRFTSAKGYDDAQLLKNNNLYGFDPVLQWFELYLPKVGQGSVVQIGRYISPIDIEAQLSNQNYLYSHSLMFGVDPYTYTGINIQVRTSKEFMYQIGITSGNENSPWSGHSNANGEFLVGWTSANGKDNLWGGLDSISPKQQSIDGHDDENIWNFVWGHVFNKRLHSQTQGYYMWEYKATVGGTPINGPNEPYALGGGIGAPIPGRAYAEGFVNNLEYKVNDNDYVSFRSGYLGDIQGWRTGFATRYTDFTLGYAHLFKKYYWVRPELRWDHAYDMPAFDLGTRRDQLTAGCDIIFRY